MSQFNVSMLVTANAEQAKRELKGAAADVQAFGTSARAAGATAATGLKVAEAEVIQLRRSTAGVTGNLVSQFNDVGQMLVAGQSPLLLAAQQGTQISQVLGPLGARGAVAALGEAFVGMLNPVNLAVFAAVAGLGLLGSSLQGLVGETKSVEDALGDLATATKDWKDAASVGLGDLKREFGSITPELIEMQRRLTELALAETLLKAADAAAALGNSFDSIFDLKSRSGDIAGMLGVPSSVVVNDPKLGPVRQTNPVITQVDEQLQTLGSDADVSTKISAVERLQDLLRGNVDLYSAENEEARAFYRNTLDIERQLQAAKAAQEGIGSAQQVATAQAERMLGSLQAEANIRQLTKRYGEESYYVAAARVGAEREAFQATLSTMTVSETMKGNLLEAWDAANGMAGALPNAARELNDAGGAADGVTRAIQDAFDLLTGAADATNVWASAMSGVAAEVRGIGAALAALGSAGIANASKTVELAALKAGKSAAEAQRSVQEAKIRDEYAVNELKVGHIMANAVMQEKLDGIELDRQIEAARKVNSEADKAGRRGAASSARQGDRNDRYLESLRAERDLLRETDPVQKEMIRNRERLAQLTAAQRVEAEKLITENAKLADQQQKEKEAWKEISDAAFDALDGLIRRGESASEVMSKLADTIAQAFLQSALLGTGPLAGIFGGQGTGLLGMIGEAFGIPANADGGYITGPGGPRDDKVLSWLSNGEYVVNAAATARHRPLLEAINAAPRFADGGIVGGNWSYRGQGGGNGGRDPIVIDLRLSDDLDARIASTAQDVSLRVTRGGIEEYDAKVLPRRMKAVNADPRRVG